MILSRVLFLMVGNKERLVLIGDGETAELAYDYFSKDSSYEVVGFSAEKAYIRHQTLLGLPVVAFEDIERVFDPQTHRVFVAVSCTQLNHLRSRLFHMINQKGYRFCSYISPKAFIGSNVQIGDNCFIFENVTLQRGVKLGANVTVWAGSSVGHQSKVGDNCFLAMHVVISGFCDVGDNCFFGVNSCTSNNLKIASDCLIGAGAVVIKDTVAGGVYVGNPAKLLPNKSTISFIEGKAAI